jgi:hypothetical protein
VNEISRVCARRAELLRQLAELEESLGRALSESLEVPFLADDILSLQEAAAWMGEPPETFRRRLEYRKALVSRPGERRHRYSRAELDRIRRDRLSAQALH